MTRGLATEQVPWASVLKPSTLEFKDKIKPISTGLWSRYGNPIIAPDWFLDKLPPFPCDGELWAGRGNFQLCRSICAGDDPDERFDQIQYAVYSSPPLEALLRTGLIKNTNTYVQMDYQAIANWMKKYVPKITASPKDSPFENELFAMEGWSGWGEQVFIHRQIILPNNEDQAAAELGRHMDNFLENGAEGIIIRDPNARWTPKRVGSLLKFKPWEDDEGTLIGFTSGRKTDKGSKHLGKIGALILAYRGKRLELSGFTDEERLFSDDWMVSYATTHPGEDMPGGQGFNGKHFKIGDKITFKYRELSDDGIPKEARYWRVRGEE
jgi:DNA ligase-1